MVALLTLFGYEEATFVINNVTVIISGACKIQNHNPDRHVNSGKT